MIKQAFAEHGLDPGDLILDGKIHRFKSDHEDRKKSGWYVGFQNHTVSSGELFHVVVFGDWSKGETYTYQDDGVKLNSVDIKNVKEQIAKAKKQNENERTKLQEEVSIEVLALWDKLSLTGKSEYLIKKQIDQCHNLGIRYDEFKGDIYVPVRDIEGRMWSWEQIDFKGNKRFYAGGRVRGCHHVIGDIGKGETIYFAEGLATAASIYLATKAPVVCVLSAGNFLPCVESFITKYSDRNFIICGDNEPTGRAKASEAATRCLGKTTFPSFKNSETGKDFNDLHTVEGIEEVQRQLEEIEIPKKMAVYALGFKEGEYFFTSTQNRQVVTVSAFSEKDFLNLMTLDYWEAMFPGKQTGVNWTQAKSNLMDQCRKKGIFQEKNIRGAGVWNDKGRIVVNMGDHLIVDGEKVDLGDLKSKFFYTLGVKLNGLHSNPLSSSECNLLLTACTHFKWRKTDFGFLMAGALVTSRICGALPIRPHTWITGGAQTGKTTLLEKLITPIIGQPCLYVQGNTSEAGVRQSLKADAIPVVFDEFETTGPRSVENISSLVELMRAAWSDSSAMIVKGGSSGNSTAYQARFSAIVSSIRTNLSNDADRGRFAVIELAPHGSDQKHWDDLSLLLNDIDEEYGNRLFSRTIKMVPILLSNFKKIKKALAKKSSQRFGDQYGMLLAGCSLLMSDEEINDIQVEFLVNNVALEEERESAKIADHDDAWSQLKTSKFEIDRSEFSFHEAMQIVKQNRDILNAQITDLALQRLGVRVDLESGVIAIVSSNHAALEAKVWKNTKWSGKWGNSLRRLPNASKKTYRVGGIPQYCVVLPIEILDL